MNKIGELKDRVFELNKIHLESKTAEDLAESALLSYRFKSGREKLAKEVLEKISKNCAHPPTWAKEILKLYE